MNETFVPAAALNDANGEIINAHGGGIIYADKKYYWFGEKRGRSASEGVNVLFIWGFIQLEI